MKKILITLFIVLGATYWLFGQQCPTVNYFATDGPGFINLSQPQNSPCMAKFCEKYIGTASVEFPTIGPFELVVVAPFPVSVVWHHPDCDSIILVQCTPTRTSVDTMVFGVDDSGYRIATLFSDTVAQIWTVVAPSNNLPQAAPFYCAGQTVLSTEAAGNTTQVTYKRLDDGKIYEKPLPVGMYFLLDSETLFPTGRKIQVVE